MRVREAWPAAGVPKGAVFLGAESWGTHMVWDTDLVFLLAKHNDMWTWFRGPECNGCRTPGS